MLDRTAIFKAAWAAYRLARPTIFAAGDESGTRRFLRPFFAKMLTKAWAEAKRAAAATDGLARDLIDGLRTARIAKVATMAPAERSARMSTIADQIRSLDYAPLGVRLAGRRAELETEFHLLSAGAP